MSVSKMFANGILKFMDFLGPDTPSTKAPVTRLTRINPVQKKFHQILEEVSRDYFTNRLKILSEKSFSYDEAKQVAKEQRALVKKIPSDVQKQVLALCKEERIDFFAKEVFQRHYLDPLLTSYHNMRQIQSTCLIPLRSYIRSYDQNKGRVFRFPLKTKFFYQELLQGLKEKELKVLGTGDVSECIKVEIKNEVFARKKGCLYVQKEPHSSSAYEYDLHLSLLPHEHIVDLLLLEKPFSYEGGRVSFASDLKVYLECADCDLYSYMGRNKLTQSLIVDLLLDVARGLVQMHENNIMHCDLTLFNILLFGKKAKIADFSHSVRKIEHAIGGTLRVSSPEMIQYKLSQKTFLEVTTLTDVWSFGILIYALLSGANRSPWANTDGKSPKEKTYHKYYEALQHYLKNPESYLKESCKKSGIDTKNPLFSIMLACLQEQKKRISIKQVEKKLLEIKRLDK